MMLNHPALQCRNRTRSIGREPASKSEHAMLVVGCHVDLIAFEWQVNKTTNGETVIF